MDATYMPISRWMDKDVVVHMHNGILLSYLKKCFWISSNEVDETGAYYTEWSNSQRKTSIQLINTYIWNLQRWSYMRDRMMILYVRQQKRHRYEEQTFGLCGRRQGWDDLREQHWNMYFTICEIDHQSKFDAWNRALKAGALRQLWRMRWGGGWEEFQHGGHMYTHGWFTSMYGKTHYNTVK